MLTALLSLKVENTKKPLHQCESCIAVKISNKWQINTKKSVTLIVTIR